METLRGVVSNLRASVEVSGGGNDSGVTTTQVASFRLGDVPALFKSREMILVADGDQVVATGTRRSGVFRVFAYRNVTTGVEAQAGMLMAILFGAGLTVVGFYLIGAYWMPSSADSALTLLFGLGFAGPGAYLLKQGLDIRRAWNALRATA